MLMQHTMTLVPGPWRERSSPFTTPVQASAPSVTSWCVAGSPLQRGWQGSSRVRVGSHGHVSAGLPGAFRHARVTGVWSSVTQSSWFSGHSRLISRGYPVDS